MAGKNIQTKFISIENLFVGRPGTDIMETAGKTFLVKEFRTHLNFLVLFYYILLTAIALSWHKIIFFNILTFWV